MSLRIAVGVLLALALLFPQPDAGALVAQAVSRLLEQDREAAAAGDRESIFSALDAAAPASGAGARLVLAEPLDPRLARAFHTSLNMHNAGRRARGLEPLRIAQPGEPAGLELTLATRESEGRMSLDTSLRSPGAAEVRLTRGPWRLADSTALVPALLAILIALAARRVVLALFAGVWVGAALLRAADGAGLAGALGLGVWDVFANYLRHELVDSFRLEVIGFVVALLAVIGVASRAGGIQGLVELVLRFARSTRSALAVSFGVGLMIFFDDYANCLLVGSSMRPITDRLRVSREKLAYVVDSTAAPVAGLSLLSTWIAFEVSTYAAQLPAAGITASPYAVFLWTLPFRFYSVFALIFVALVIWTGRDFGPMLAAERRARRTGQLVRPGGQALVSEEVSRIEPYPALAPRPRNALIPIGTVIVVTIEEIFRAGGGWALLGSDPARLRTLEGLTQLLYDGGGAGPLFRAACVALGVAVMLVGSNSLRLAVLAGVGAALGFAQPLAAWSASLLPAGLAGYAGVGLAFALGAVPGALAGRLLRTSRPHLPWTEIRRSAISATHALGFAVVILLLAWMIGRVCEDVGTADYLVALSSGRIAPSLLPIVLFGVACVVGFSTGTSWGTMSILLPNVVGLATVVGASHALGPVGMLTVCIGAVLEGSIFGDHCSPISDTTVLSSVASGSDHIDHVRTQLPYAVCVAGVALLAGYLPTMLLGGWSFPAALVVGSVGLGALLLLFGRDAERPTPSQSTTSL